LIAKLSILDKINLFIRVYVKLFVSVFKISPWIPFLAIALFQAGGLMALIWVKSPVWTIIIQPFLSVFLTDGLFHFPLYYLALPFINSIFDSFILGPTIWILLLATAIYKLGGVYTERPTHLKDGINLAFKSYLPLLAVWLIETALIMVILLLPSELMSSSIKGSPRVNMAFDFCLQMAAYVVTAFLIYTIPGIIIARKKISAALGDSIKLCFHNFFLTCFIVIIPGIFLFLPDFILANYGLKITRIFNPQIVVVILYLKISAGIFLNFFMYGAAVFVYKELFDSD